MQLVSTILALFSVLIPTKQWYSPSQPLTIAMRSDVAVSLVLTGFDGKRVDPKGSIDVSPNGATTQPTTVNLRDMYPAMSNPGTYVLFAVPKGNDISEFVGTPLVIQTRSDHRPGASGGLMVIHVEPMRYAVMDTDQGSMTMAFYYDAAPNTIDSFLRLCEEGFYDGILFHRIVPGYVIQAGDPLGNGSGGPGYKLDAEFSDRPHLEGALSMAREGDPDESSAVLPRPEFADSAGSQFFICLDYQRTQRLDRRYTVFGQVVDGIDVVQQMGKLPNDEKTNRPDKPPVIQKVSVFAVTRSKNPYLSIINLGTSKPATRPTLPP